MQNIFDLQMDLAEEGFSVELKLTCVSHENWHAELTDEGWCLLCPAGERFLRVTDCVSAESALTALDQLIALGHQQNQLDNAADISYNRA
jgi:hypothetical protein